MALPPRAFTLCLCEPAAGMISQVQGLAQAVGLPSELGGVTLRFPWILCWPGFIPASRFVFRSRTKLDLNRPPRVVITCGRQAVMASLYLKKHLGERVFTVHIQDPRISTRRFDLVIAPEHDGLTGPNVFCTRGAVHHIRPANLQAAAAAPPESLACLKQPFATVLLGGPNNCYSFTPADLGPLIAQLKQSVHKTDLKLAILPSRRTPDEVLEQFRRAFGGEHFVWDRQGGNPYLAALGLCTHVVATGDSVSMISEAAATEKPVFVFHLPERRRSRRFARFHAAFEEAGIARRFAGRFENWTYSSPNATDQIAELIRNRLGDCHVVSARPAA
jgi:mitochondrial fission protein ELM1